MSASRRARPAGPAADPLGKPPQHFRNTGVTNEHAEKPRDCCTPTNLRRARPGRMTLEARSASGPKNPLARARFASPCAEMASPRRSRGARPATHAPRRAWLGSAPFARRDFRPGPDMFPRVRRGGVSEPAGQSLGPSQIGCETGGPPPPRSPRGGVAPGLLGVALGVHAPEAKTEAASRREGCSCEARRPLDSRQPILRRPRPPGRTYGQTVADRPGSRSSPPVPRIFPRPLSSLVGGRILSSYNTNKCE